MSTPQANRHRDFWQRQAVAVSRKVNLAWWLDSSSTPLVVFSLIAGIALLVVRREAPSAPAWALSLAIAAALLLLAGICWIRAMRRFEQPTESMVRIEAAMRLRNALSAADAGISPWPAPAPKIDAGIRWQWPRLWIPVLGSLLLLAAGLWIPVTANPPRAQTTPDQPQAWKQLSAELDQLTQEAVVDEKYLEETRKKLEELQAQEEDQWFSHSSLEATDSLKKSHRAESERVQRELGRADKALGNLQKGAGAGEAEKNKQMEELQQALEGLQNGAMKPNPQLLEQMKQLGMQDLANLDPEQLQQLREQMEKIAQGMKDAGNSGEGEDWDDELLGGDGEGEGEGDCEGNGGQEGEGPDGEGPGKGGVNRGPGHDPKVLGKQKEQIDTGEMTGIQSKDLSRTAPGDLLELQDGEHQVDRTRSQVTSGGESQSTGKGGDRVWKESLDPDEQRALKRYFK